MTPGAVLFRLGVDPDIAGAMQVISTVIVLIVVVVAALRATAEASYLVAVTASQLLSPVLWDHYAMLLLLPVAYLLAAGHRWAVLIPLATSTLLINMTPPIVYPICFFVTLFATMVVGWRPAPSIRAAEPVTVVRLMPRRLDRMTVVGFGVVAVSALIYWWVAKDFDAYRGDFFYLADAFLHGRTWLDFAPGPNDVIIGSGDHFYVPFAPFPAIALMPLVAITGPVTADEIESGVNAILAASTVGMGWWLLGRIGVQRVWDRVWLVALLGFSTQILWITTRGGVWHTGHLIATLLTLGCLIELWGKRRAWLIGLLAGAAFLTRAPLAFAIPFYALVLIPESAWSVADLRGLVGRAWAAIPWRSWVWLAAGVLPSIAFFFLYNQLRFDNPLESGYALATLPPWLEAQREQGLVLARPRPDEPRLPVLPPADGRRDGVPVLPPGRPGNERAADLARAPVRDPGRLAATAAVAAARRRRARADPDAALLRRRLAAVRLPLLPRLDPVHLGDLRNRGRLPRRRELAVAGGDPVGLVVMAFAPHFAYRI